MQYRAEIDGLRALAVVPVILFHAGLPGFDGGFVGVDVFFVISGFLITQILVTDMDRGSFRLTHFYMRRASRLLPALYLVLFCCAVYMVVWQPPFAARDLAQSIAATTLYVQNMLLIAESSSYFRLDNELKPLLHAWSLAVEEQFYLIYPIALLALVRLKGMARLTVLSLFCLLGFIVSSLLFHSAPVHTFYTLPTRAWELLLGAVAALLAMDRVHEKIHLFSQQVLSMFGLTLILSAMLMYGPTTDVPGFAAIAPALGTGLILLFARSGTLVYRLLSMRMAVLVGLGSYSAYLWHQPVFAIARSEFYVSWTLSTLIVLALIIGGLSWLSYTFVEQPFRSRSIPVKRQVQIFAGLTALFLVIGYAGHRSWGFEAIKLNAVSAERQSLYVSHRDAVADRREALRAIKRREAETPTRDGYLLVGDSMSEDLLMAMQSQGFPSVQWRLDPECFADIAQGRPACGKSLEVLIERGQAQSAIIIAANLAGSGLHEAAIDLYERLKGEGFDVKILGVLKLRHGTNLSYQYARSNMTPAELAGRVFHSRDPGNNTNDLIKRSIPAEDFLDKFALFCDRAAETCRTYSDDDEGYMYDQIHLTVDGASYVGSRMNELFNR